MSEITLSCSVLKNTRNSALEEMLLTQQKLPSSEIKSLEMNGYFKATSITLFISFFALYNLWKGSSSLWSLLHGEYWLKVDMSTVLLLI